ncbi:MAG: hypothetical protein F6K40_24400 [Okeania sp. SIO3I5]|uniref:hypothetical protein n=1 Tax=Okeania sp. SIO3I5 TaxID=2607805 RepID=UPI0013BE085D|nr:hypothetical protein [Okeania sp. SIO3I5]NEQ39219.1 hypothetical protein [Okeania sp. SIO3I5]
MEPATIIVTALAIGAVTGMKSLVEQAVKDGYQSLKNLIKTKYPDVGVDRLEKKPESKTQQAAVEEEIADLGVDKDTEILKKAEFLLDTAKNLPAENVLVIGVDLEKIEAAALKIKDIIATGTGVKVREGKFQGEIDIEQVRAGQENTPKT